MASNEMVLYYRPEKKKEAVNSTGPDKLKGVLIRMGVRIRNIKPEQTGQTVGFLAGLPGFEETKRTESLPVIEEEMLVMRNFTSRRVDELLAGLRRAGAPKIGCKALVTESNSGWSFYSLYQELKREREAMERQREEAGKETGKGEAPDEQ